VVVSWGIDQRGITKRLKHWNGFPNNVHFTIRNDKIDRIDRSYHKNNYVWTSQKVEAHVLRPAFTAKNWPRIRAVLSHALYQEQMEWIDGYAEHICSMLCCTNASVKILTLGYIDIEVLVWCILANQIDFFHCYVGCLMSCMNKSG